MSLAHPRKPLMKSMNGFHKEAQLPHLKQAARQTLCDARGWMNVRECESSACSAVIRAARPRSGERFKGGRGVWWEAAQIGLVIEILLFIRFATTMPFPQ